MRDRRTGELAADLLQEPFEARGALRDERLQRPDRDRRVRPIGEDLRGPIRILTTLEMTTLMPRLTARLATRPLPQAPVRIRARLRVPVRRRRPRRVPRVLIKLGAQFRHDGLQLNDPRGLRSDQLLEL